MNILALTRYGRSGASSRLRFHQYLPALRSAGLSVECAPLFSDAYVLGLQQGHRRPAEVIRAYARRSLDLARTGAFDLLWIEKEALPWLPAWLERMLMRERVPYVLDYDDAVFHGYDQHRRALVKWALGNKHPALVRRAALVVAGNEYLAAFARSAGAPWVETVPTVIDLHRYPVPDFVGDPSGQVPCVGWIGQRSTAACLAPLAPTLQMFVTEGRARFVAVGIDAARHGLPMESIPWSEASEVASIRGFDIGIMPLPDEPFERGKCGYKLIQYMACGLPVVASPVGVNRQIVQHGVNGFLADTPSQWQQALQTLAENPDLRRRMGRAGRRQVEQHYALQVAAPRMAGLLHSAVQTATKADH